jgi:hypothetical protein
MRRRSRGSKSRASKPVGYCSREYAGSTTHTVMHAPLDLHYPTKGGNPMDDKRFNQRAVSSCFVSSTLALPDLSLRAQGHFYVPLTICHHESQLVLQGSSEEKPEPGSERTLIILANAGRIPLFLPHPAFDSYIFNRKYTTIYQGLCLKQATGNLGGFLSML